MLRASLFAVTLACAALYAQPAGAQVVRAYHPRIFLSAAGQRGVSPVTLRARCEAPTSLYARACRVAAPLPTTTFPGRDAPLTIINSALRYLLYNEDSALQAVRDEVNRVGGVIDRGDESGQILTNAARVLHLAVAYDWLYDALTPTDRAQIQSFIETYAEYNLRHQPQDVFSSEAYAHAAAIGLAGLALATPGESAMMPGQRYIAYANLRWRGTLLPSMGYTAGWWPEGPAWFNNYAGRFALYYAIAWTTATGEDLFAFTRQSTSDAFGAAVRYEAYALRPDMRYPTFGDAFATTPAGATGQRAVLDMLAWATGSPVAQALANEVSLRLPVGQDYAGPEAWHQIVFNDPRRPAQPARIDLPLAAHLAPTSSDVVVMRGSWMDPDAMHVTLSCGDWFTRRQHLEAGSFQIYRRAPLAVHTGTWDGFETQHWVNWYAQRSVHANTLAVMRPGELFPNARMLPSVNDGGQRSTPYASVTRASLGTYRMNLTEGAQFETGSVTAFESSRFHDYAACDITRAYNSTAVTTPGAAPKVREVTRQVVMLRPELLVVFDRIESTDPSYEKRFLLHATTRPVPDRDGVFSFSRATGRLIGRTLLPRDATQQVIDGYRVGDVTLAPMVTTDDNQGARIEVTARGAARTYFLHVFDATDTDHASLPPLSLIEDDTRSGVRIGDPSGERTYTVTFPRTGPTGGEIRVQDMQGANLYQGALGAGGTFYPAVTDASLPRTDASVDASTSVPDDMGRQPLPGGGGCSCEVGVSPRGRTAGLGALMTLWALGRIRRRR